jgi:hypothetical protein
MSKVWPWLQLSIWRQQNRHIVACHVGAHRYRPCVICWLFCALGRHRREGPGNFICVMCGRLVPA